MGFGRAANCQLDFGAEFRLDLGLEQDKGGNNVGTVSIYNDG